MNLNDPNIKKPSPPPAPPPPPPPEKDSFSNFTHDEDAPQRKQPNDRKKSD